MLSIVTDSASLKVTHLYPMVTHQPPAQRPSSISYIMGSLSMKQANFLSCFQFPGLIFGIISTHLDWAGEAQKRTNLRL